MLREDSSQDRRLVVYGEASIDLSNQYVFDQLIRAVKNERARYEQLCDDVERILTIYEKMFPEIVDRINTIKREIRWITEGTPVTESLDPTSSQSLFLSDPNFNAQQYEAFTVMLKNAYRQAAMATHPDREGGNKDLFEQVNRAYKDRDLDHLIYLYLSVSAFPNLYWRQSEEGIYFASNELERYTAFFTKLRASEAFKVARFHTIGAPWKAETQMHLVLLQHVAKYQNELNYLRNKYHGNSKQEAGSEGINQDHKEAIGQGDSDQQGQEARCGCSKSCGEEAGGEEGYSRHDATGEGTSGPPEWHGQG